MDAELQALIDAGRVNAGAATLLEKLRPGTFCLHKSWGFGQVKEWRLLVNQLVVDFDAKKRHPMQLQYAADTLQPLSESHIYVQKTLHAPELKRLGQEDPARLVELVIVSFEDKVTPDQLQKVLAPDVVTEGEFKRWWDNARKVLRKSGRFTLPARKSDPITLRDQSVSVQAEVLQAFQDARRPKEQSAYLEQILRDLDAFTPEQLQTLITHIEEVAGQNIRLNPAAAAELLLARDEIARKRPGLVAGDLSVAQVLREQAPRLAEFIGQVSTAKQRALMNQTRSAFPEEWAERLLSVVSQVGYRTVSDIARLLEEGGHADTFRHQLLRTLREHSISSDVLSWLCRERASQTYADLIGPELLGAILSALEREQFNTARRNSKLHDLLLDDRELVADLLAQAPPGQARDLMRRMMTTPAIEEVSKRSLLARMIRVHPELQTMLSGQSDAQEQPLVVSWQSLQRRKAEYDDLVARKIPENTKEISVARSYGDLRENFEYKAAKEMQTVLLRRKAELEQMLARARGTSFDQADTAQVSIGTTATLRDTATAETFIYHVLGAWDSEPEKRIISYQTAIGQALLGRKRGDLVELNTENGTRSAQIVSIDAAADVLPDQQQPVLAAQLSS
ncbi:MAG: GreA/GreB family elongation factor [Verrucomicrobia bacterium]|nr:GreA/GreB family elongation factor [Verrucomicrobiota bacterium]